MMVIGFFRDLFDGFGSVLEFVTKPLPLFKDMGFDMSILKILSLSLGAFLLVVLGLHVWHLIKPIG